LLKWGTVNVPAGNASIAFPTPPAAPNMPAFTGVIIATVVPYTAAANRVCAKMSALSTTHIDIQVMNVVTGAYEPHAVNYIVLGY
jgi:hypothetical protein